MYSPRDVVNLDNDPLGGKTSRTAIVLAESSYDDWTGVARFNVVCLSTDFDEYESNPHTIEIHKDQQTAVGSLNDHSLVCPWATLALSGTEMSPVTTDSAGSANTVEVTDACHEAVSRAVYQFFSDHNSY